MKKKLTIAGLGLAVSILAGPLVGAASAQDVEGLPGGKGAQGSELTTPSSPGGPRLEGPYTTKDPLPPVVVPKDSDQDGLSDEEEGRLGTDPNNSDTDKDGLGDPTEVAGLHGKTDPTNPDTDGDGLADGIEAYVTYTDPTKWDTDGDGASDSMELLVLGTDPNWRPDLAGFTDVEGDTIWREPSGKK